MTARISHTRSVILHINGPNQLTLHLLRRACAEIVVLIKSRYLKGKMIYSLLDSTKIWRDYWKCSYTCNIMGWPCTS